MGQRQFQPGQVTLIGQPGQVSAWTGQADRFDRTGQAGGVSLDGIGGTSQQEQGSEQVSLDMSAVIVQPAGPLAQVRLDMKVNLC